MTRGDDPETGRRLILRRLRSYFTKRRWPRLVMSAVLGLTGLAGFFASYVMLNIGLEKMWQRYPLAALIAWGVFLGLMRLWAELERRALPRETDISFMEDDDDSPDRRDQGARLLQRQPLLVLRAVLRGRLTESRAKLHFDDGFSHRQNAFSL